MAIDTDPDVSFFEPIKKKEKKPLPSVVTNEILDRLEKVESGGRADIVNPKSGAQGAFQFLPKTVEMLRAKGIKFDPFNKQEARNAARVYLQQLVDQNQGDIEKALAIYGGHIKADPTNYVNMVMGRSSIGKNKTEDEDVSFFTKPTPQPTQPSPEEKISNQAAFGIYPRVSGRRAVIEQAKPPSTEGLGTELASMADVVGNLPASLVNLGSYIAQRPFRSPQESQQTAQQLSTAIANPVGRVFGVAQTPQYQQSPITAPLRQLGTYTQQKAKEISEATGYAEPDVEAAINLGLMAAPLGAKAIPPIARGVGDIYSGVSTGVSNIRQGMGNVVQKQMAQQFAQKQAPIVSNIPPEFQSGGAAAVQHTNAVMSAINEARPELQASLANKNPLEITPQELKAIEIHNKFAKVDKDFVPTEGQARQDVTQLSDEYNLSSRPGYEKLRAKLIERDPFLVKGFNNVKEEFAPQHSGVGLQGKANNILEDVKTNKVDVDNQNIKNAYEALNNTNGDFVVDMQQAAKNALAQIEKDKRTNRIPKEMKETLDKYANGEYVGNAVDFENMRTDTAADMRKAQRAGDGTQEHVIKTIKNAFEELPMKGEEALAFKEKADLARSLFKRQKDMLDPKNPTYNKLYAMAFEDNRTPNEILMGNVPHPASKAFFDTFIAGNKTTPADLSRALELVGKDSASHHEIIAGLTDYLKQKSGIIDEKGNVSQSALRKELNKFGPNLDLIAGPEVANRLRNIGDVAELSEHVRNRGGGSANVSQTAKTTEREAAKKATQDLALGVFETAANIKTGGASGAVASVLKPMFKARRERLAQEAAQAKILSEVNRMVSPNAGINTEPMRIELSNMLPNRP